jgi:hypothetical protein
MGLIAFRSLSEILGYQLSRQAVECGILAASVIMGKICEMQIPSAGQVKVWINSRDHCDPHVHCGDKSDTWEGRVKFSFINNAITFWDMLSQNGPGRNTFTEIERRLTTYLPACRQEWWKNFSASIGCCIQNTTQEDTIGQQWRVTTANYDPATNSTELVFSNGFRRTVRL